MLTEITGPFLGGIGIFFVGASMVGQNLKKMTSRRLRMLFAKFTSRDWQSSILGLLSGLVTQSPSVSAFIMAGLSASGLVKVRNALPVTFWSNAGCSILVVVAVLDIKYLVFLLLFMSGVSVAFDKPRSMRFLGRALFGVGLLFLGLQFIRDGAAPLAAMPWVREALAASHGSAIMAFFLGTILTIITQTSLGVVIIAITMTEAGLFSVEQAIMLVYGVELGSSFVTWFLSSGVKGTAKQLVMSQVCFNAMAVVIMVFLFYVEVLGGVPLVKALIETLSPDLKKQIAYMVVLYNFGVPVLASFIYDHIQNLLNRFWPPTKEESLAKIKFIKDHTLNAPAAALIMVEKELLRLVGRLPRYMRETKASGDGLGGGEDIGPYHSAFENISREIGYTLSDISEKELNEDSSSRLLRLLNIQELIIALEQNLTDFTSAARETGDNQVLRRFSTAILESQEFLLMQAVDALSEGDAEDMAILRTVTSDSGDMIKQVRKQYLEAEEGLDFNGKAALHKLSGLFERTAWLLNRLSVAVEPEEMERSLKTA